MNSELPLNEPQQRHITVALAALEKQLTELRERLQRRPSDSRLLHYDDPVSAEEAALLLPIIADSESRLRRIADDLLLPAQVEPARRSFIAGLELAGIHLYECTDEGGLGGYGAVATATADYLAREIPKLDAAIQSLIRQLHKPLRAVNAEMP